MILVLSSVFVLEHGGEQLAKPGTSSADNSAHAGTETVSLHDLTTSAGIQKYSGKSVSTGGTLYFNSSTNNFQIVSGEENYPVTIKSPNKLAQLEGQPVIVTGTFRLVPGSGPTIDSAIVELDGSPTPSPKNI